MRYTSLIAAERIERLRPRRYGALHSPSRARGSRCSWYVLHFPLLAIADIRIG